MDSCRRYESKVAHIITVMLALYQRVILVWNHIWLRRAMELKYVRRVFLGEERFACARWKTVFTPGPSISCQTVYLKSYDTKQQYLGVLKRWPFQHFLHTRHPSIESRLSMSLMNDDTNRPTTTKNALMHERSGIVTNVFSCSSANVHVGRLNKRIIYNFRVSIVGQRGNCVVFSCIV